MDYITLWQLREELDIAADATGDDSILRRLIRGSKSFADAYSRRRFDAVHRVKQLDYPIRPRSAFGRYPLAAAWMVNELAAVNDMSDGLLRIQDDLLEALSVTNGDGTVLTADQWWYEPADTWPKYALRLKTSAGVLWRPATSGDNRQCIPVDGVYAYHTRYDRAWADSLDTVQDAPLGAGSTLITVTDADGAPEDNDEPRFQVGQQIRLGTAAAFEYCEVRLVTVGSPDSITVKRGVNGTTAQAWPQNTPIAIWRPEETVVRGLARLATWAYRLKDVAFFERLSLLGTAQKIAPGAVPPDALDFLPAPRPPSLA
jgi:hypothetical protein